MRTLLSPIGCLTSLLSVLSNFVKLYWLIITLSLQFQGSVVYSDFYKYGLTADGATKYANNNNLTKVPVHV